MNNELLLYAVIPAFNEESKIAKTVSIVTKFVNRIIVIDDGSQDKTASVAKAAGADIIIKHGVNTGQGASIRSGIQRALLEGADIAITIDGDFQHDPNDIPEITKPIVQKECDIVIGSRFFKGILHIPKMRFLFNMILSICYRILFGFKAIDSQSGFRAFNRNAMKVMNFQANRYDWTCEVADIIVQNRLTYKEVGITIRYFDKKDQASVQVAVSMFVGMLRYYLHKHLYKPRCCKKYLRFL